MWPFKSSTEWVAEFKATRSPQDSEEFVRACSLPTSPASSALAIGVRAAIAELGEVDSTYIRADDGFDDDLIKLPFWGSLDGLAIILTLQDHLGIRISDEEAQRIRNPESSSGMTVADFVTDIFDVLGDKMAT